MLADRPPLVETVPSASVTTPAPVTTPTPVPTPTPAPTAGPDTVVVNASASLAGGRGAHFNLVVDGATIGSATVDSTTTQAYSFSTTLAGGSSAAHDIQVLFDNDAVISGQDRNLYLQSISVDGQAIAATDGREVYHATGSASTGFGPGDVASNGTMYWQGVAEFKLPAAATVPTPTPTPAPTAGPDTVVVNASASLAGGMGAHFNLVVDGATIGSATVDSTTTQAYSFSTTLAGGSSAAHDIQVLFDNDAVINGQDRNLYLQSISVDGQAMAATDGREVYHATGSASTGFGPGDVASNGNMYWQGAAEFKLPAAATVPTPTPTPTAESDTVVVNASASLAGGMGAHFNLVVDGATIGSATVDSTTTQAYSFSTTLAGGSSAAHDIQVQFDNDAVINGQDRNLYLQSISVDSQAMAATDGREVYHATGSAGTGYGPGDVASNGNMYWQGCCRV